MPEKITPEQIQEIFKKNGISSIEDLANELASNQDKLPGAIIRENKFGGEHDASWVIKVRKLSADNIGSDIRNLPSELGGNILNK